ncbi:hypothetical protein HYU19_02310 [Candidatus Woesearchaeota archaeon]|nr:hypothetical protein [Candidatus Woesearchaeota archaeon]
MESVDVEIGKRVNGEKKEKKRQGIENQTPPVSYGKRENTLGGWIIKKKRR